METHYYKKISLKGKMLLKEVVNTIITELKQKVCNLISSGLRLLLAGIEIKS